MSEEKYNIDEYPVEEELEEVMKLNKEQVKIIEDLQQKVEQLESIRKETIEFTNSHFKQMVADDEAQVLLNILNKGSE